MFDILLQADSTAAAAATVAQSETIWSLLSKGIKQGRPHNDSIVFIICPGCILFL